MSGLAKQMINQRVAKAAIGLALALSLGSAVHAQEMAVKWKGAPEFSNDDVSFKVRGRFLMDAVFQDVSREGTLSDFKTRSVRGRQAFIGVEGKLNAKFAYKFEGGFVNGGTSTWDDAVLEYKALETTSILFGNIKATGLENLTSTRFTEFLDRGPYGDFGVESYLLGVVVKSNGPNWTVTGAAQGASLNSGDFNQACVANVQTVATTPTTSCNSKEQMVYTGRVSVAPILSDDNQVHLAASVRQRDRGSQGAFVYAARPNTNFGTNGAYLNSGGVADKDTTVAVEGAWVHKNLSVQGEYSAISFNRIAGQAGGDGDVKVGYVFATWAPTGEVRAYDPTKGEFGRTKILDPITAGGKGGWVLGARYDYADLKGAYNGTPNQVMTGGTSLAGQYKAVTLGATYYPMSYVRFMANYTDAKIDNPARLSDVGVKQMQFRAQIDF
jgi:phosphate-selective porin OprO/OprP